MTERPTLRGFANLLWRLADLVRASEDRRSFRAKAYRAAVWALDDLPGIDASDEDLLAVPGIGPGVIALTKEYRASGRLTRLATLDESYPRDAPRLLRLPRMRSSMLRELKGLGVETVADLAFSIETGAVETLRGAGPQTVNLWQRIMELSPGPGWVPAHEAWIAAMQLTAHIARHTGQDTRVAGSVRRVDEWTDRGDLVVTTRDRHAVRDFVERSAVLMASSETATGNIVAKTHSGFPVELWLSAPEEMGSTMVAATGPAGHVDQLKDIGAHASETSVYRAAGLPWIPPPARSLPVSEASRVVKVEDLKGDLHIHSIASPDGRMSLETIVRAAVSRGYEYILITDHTRGLRFGGLDAEGLAIQGAEIRRLREEFPEVTMLHGAELNITRDGTLDIEDQGLEILDFAVAGVHSHFGLVRAEQTERVVSVIIHPKVRVLAHPFGRRIGIRPPLDIDMEAVITAAIDHGVALETNGHRDRLDLPAQWAHWASEHQGLFAANSDAHRVDELDNIANAVATLQKAGVGPGRVVNAFPIEDMVRWASESSTSC